jgi:hypothetical protein|tara:strand:- start:3956 stop:4666 length:711 start_codon:yes stop_codon:yes gene_type:complete
MSDRKEIPYYFEIPELSMPSFDVKEYFVSDEERTIARTDVKTSDRLTGNSRTNTANWYQSFIKVEENSSQDKRDFNQVNLYEEANFDLTKLLKEWLHDHINLKFTSVLMLRTPANTNSRWHCEGPVFHTRQCALNFPVSGDFTKSEAQWATFPRFKDIDPRENEKHGYVTQTDMKDTEMLCRWDNQTVPGFQNTMIMHRGYNEHCDTDRVILSAAVEDTADINVVYKKYIAGNLFK